VCPSDVPELARAHIVSAATSGSGHTHAIERAISCPAIPAAASSLLLRGCAAALLLLTAVVGRRGETEEGESVEALLV
jgi:hypothetical protein